MEQKKILAQRHIENNRYQFYVPNGKSEEFIKGFAQDKMVNIFCGGNGTSKTVSLVNIVANICWEPNLPWFDFPIFHKWPHLKQLRIISDPTTIADKMVPEMKKWFPKGRYTTGKEKRSYEYRWQTDTGFSITLMTYDQDLKEFESVDLGACIEENQRILLSNGVWKKIKNVKVGDDVVTFGLGGTRDSKHNRGLRQPRKQQFRKIIAVYNNGFKDVYLVKCNNGYSVEATLDHKFYVVGKGWIQLKDIIVGDKLIIKFPKCKYKNLKIDNWKIELLGAWIGDGWFKKSACVSCYDEKYLEHIKNLLPSTLKLKRMKGWVDYFGDFAITRNKDNSKIRKNEFTKFLEEVDLIDKKANNKFIPDIIFKASLEQKYLFLSGLFSTDGWVGKESIGYGTTSKQLVEDLQLLLLECGIKSGIYFKKKQNEKWNNQWFVNLTGASENLKFLSKIIVIGKNKHSEICLDKNRERVKNKCGSLKFINRSYQKTIKRVKIRSIKHLGKKNVYDISVDGTHNFLCNGILTHNCFMDEPAPQMLFNASLSRLRLGGKCGLFMTPLASAAYIYEEFIEGYPEGYDEDNRAFYIYADVEDNCVTHGVRGFLKHENIEQLINLYNEDEKEARLHGRFMGLIGLIYNMFDPTKHVLPYFEEVSENWIKHSWKVVWAIDQHPVTPTHVMFMALLSNGQKVVIDEIFKIAQVKELASLIVEKLRYFKSKGGIPAKVGLIDASSVIEDQLRGGDSVINDFIKNWKEMGYDYKLVKASKDRDRGEDIVKQELKGTINPNLYICKMRPIDGNRTQGETLWEIKRYGKDPKRPERRIDKDDHAMESLYRLILANLHILFSKTTGEKRTKIIKGIGL